MKKQESVLIHVPPYWAGILISVIAAAIATGLVLWGYEGSSRRYMDSEMYLIIAGFIFVYSCISYTVHTDYLTIKIFGIPVRRIHWICFSGATYVCDRKSRKGVDQPNCILLTLRPANPFLGTSDMLRKYKRSNRFRYIELLIPDGKDQEYVSALEALLREKVIGYHFRNNADYGECKTERDNS